MTEAQNKSNAYIGFGTYKLKGEIATKSVLTALNVGYRHIDTATLYKNEIFVGHAISNTNINRSELFLTTKISNSDQIKGKNYVLNSFASSLADLKTDYIDLLLVHNPIKGKIIDTWQVVEYLFAHKKCLQVGVSNFLVEDLDWFFSTSGCLYSTIAKPTTNQIELSPYNTQLDVVKYCHSNNIRIEAHTSLTRGTKLNDPKLVSIAKSNNMSTPELLLKWGLQNNYTILPRSSDEKKISANFNLDMINNMITDENMYVLNNDFNENYCLIKRRI
jgi:diketogulonate reductase-like aldo/keto reductase